MGKRCRQVHEPVENIWTRRKTTRKNGRINMTMKREEDEGSQALAPHKRAKVWG